MSRLPLLAVLVALASRHALAQGDPPVPRHVLYHMAAFGAPDRSEYLRALSQPPPSPPQTRVHTLQHLMVEYLAHHPIPPPDQNLRDIAAQLEQLRQTDDFPAAAAFACRLALQHRRELETSPWLAQTVTGDLAQLAPTWCQTAFNRHPHELRCLQLHYRFKSPDTGIYTLPAHQRRAALESLAQTAESFTSESPCAYHYLARALRDLGHREDALLASRRGGLAGDPESAIANAEAAWHDPDHPHAHQAGIKAMNAARRRGHARATARFAVMNLIVALHKAGFRRQDRVWPLIAHPPEKPSEVWLRDDVRFPDRPHHRLRNWIRRAERAIAKAQAMPPGLAFFDGAFAHLVENLELPLPREPAR